MTEEPREIDELMLHIRELLEIEKMRNLEIACFDTEVDAIHKTKDKRINELAEELWHATRRGDDLDRRWNELALSYEQVRGDLDRTGEALNNLQAQRGYRLAMKITSLVSGGPVRRLVRKIRPPHGPKAKVR
jgi:chromosome segregation ATPase